MIKKALTSLGSLVLKILILAIVAYILFGIGRSIWKNWQLVQQIKKTEESISQLQAENQNLQNQILYYQTETFKELEARRRLGLKKPDENLIILPENTDSDSSGENLIKKSSREPESQNRPNPLKWWDYLMGR